MDSSYHLSMLACLFVEDSGLLKCNQPTWYAIDFLCFRIKEGCHFVWKAFFAPMILFKLGMHVSFVWRDFLCHCVFYREQFLFDLIYMFWTNVCNNIFKCMITNVVLEIKIEWYMIWALCCFDIKCPAAECISETFIWTHHLKQLGQSQVLTFCRYCFHLYNR